MKTALVQEDDHVRLAAIEGERLSAITFVQDYLQLHFDGPILTAITRPIVVVGDTSLDLESPGYRDALCGLIAATVTRAYVRPGDRIQVDFKENKSLIISLKPEAYRSAEAVIFGDGSGEQWAVW